MEILTAAAPGGLRLTDIAKETGYSPQELNYPINFLLRSRYLARSKQVYYIPDPTLRFFLQYCYPLQEEVYLADLDAKIDRFRSQAEAMLAAYRTEVGKGHEARVRELFRAFDGRQRLHGRLLPRFVSVDTMVQFGEEFDLVARSGEKYWIGEIKARPARQRDVDRFLVKLEAIVGWDVQERLMICLAGMDSHAQSRAREAGLWVWSLADVNTLMKTYGQFRLLV